jgi:hypothetical protein
MGIIAQGKNLWNALFTRTQRQVLGLMFGYPERSFYANEVVRKAGVGTGSVQRELARLAECGLLTVTRIGNQKHFQANPHNPIYPEVRSIVLKTFGALDLLRAGLLGLSGTIHLAWVYGEDLRSPQFQNGEIKLLLVADGLEYTDLASDLTEVENRIGRTLAPLLFSVEAFRRLTAEGDETLRAILRQPGIAIIGSIDEV